ncbi:MAG: chorismate synthase [Eubacteriales bacterium]|nr:chorismate synthase [Eubacteriales bacterium]
MTNTFGSKVKISIYGTSHAPEIGAIIEGLPKGIEINEEKLSEFMDRRRAKGNLATRRHEADKVIFESGVKDGETDGESIKLVIKNGDVRSKDYENVSKVPRPNHADFAAYMKYGDSFDFHGGGQFSGRLTAVWCACGFIFLEILGSKGIQVVSHVKRIGEISDISLDSLKPDEKLNKRLKSESFPVIIETKREKMAEAIVEKSKEQDSMGGEIECAVYGLPAGLGADFFGGLEALIAQSVFSVPAVKGLEFGKGFDFAKMCGSLANDGFTLDENGEIKTVTNNCGGILGGISSGMPLTLSCAFKPTPSISRPQKSVDLNTHEEVTLEIKGRHDPCIVPRACAVVESAVAMALVNADGFDI